MGHNAENDAGCDGHYGPGSLREWDECPLCNPADEPRRRTEAEARRCSQEDCPGDGRYQPPGRGHMPDCQHDAVAWVWETVTSPDVSDSTAAPLITNETREDT